MPVGAEALLVFLSVRKRPNDKGSTRVNKKQNSIDPLISVAMWLVLPVLQVPRMSSR